MRRFLALLWALAAGMSEVSAQDVENGVQIAPDVYLWQALPGLSSATMAALGWRLVGTSGQGVPLAYPATVTYWDRGDGTILVRCIDFFNIEMDGTGGFCEQPVLLAND